jgi:hypothetical protein
MIKEHDRIVLACDVEAEGLTVGDIGTVIHVYSEGAAFEVEFVALDGQTAAVVTLDADKVRPVRAGEIPHARSLSAA